MKTALIVAQAATFVGLGLNLLLAGNWKLGAAQLCLAAVTGLVYT